MPVTNQPSDHPHNPDRRKFLSWLPLRLLDIVALALSISIAAIITHRVLKSRHDSKAVRITSGKSSWILNLDQDEILEITGPLGISRIAVQQGQVYMKSSPCPNKICIKTGSISNSGQWIACLPNRVFVAVEGIKEDHIDAESY